MHSSYFTLKTIRKVLVFKIKALACPEGNSSAKYIESLVIFGSLT